jgi:hypothetical protein
MRSPECPYKQGIQTVDHLTFQCKKLKNETEILKNSALKVDNWPMCKRELTNSNMKKFIRYINSMDLENINNSNEQM